ncbi:hypothetical protein V5O48_006961 [Marasmius crinis-equi]|uniref:F-box domain-containing protein n=1 Tax=Marasmius crinis-equi TaxID=585013 RepID=A0ABR3FI45_9AGAR
MSIPERIALAEENARLEEGNRQLLDEIKRLKEENEGLQKFAEEKRHLDELDNEIRRLNGLAGPRDFVFELSKNRSEIRFYGSSRFSATGGMPRRLEFNPERCQTPEPSKLRFPSEILLEIFKAFCSSGSNLILEREWPRRLDSDYESSESTSPAEEEQNLCETPPFRLSLVCRLWRTLVVSEPSIWSTFTLDPGKWAACEPSVLPLYLERSRETPLHVTLLDSGYNEEPDPYWAAYGRKEQLITQLFSHGDRISSLVVKINEAKFLTGHFTDDHPTTPQFPWLTSLELRWYRRMYLGEPEDSEEEEPQFGLKQMFKHVPKLVSLTAPYDHTMHRLTLIHMLKVITVFSNLQEFNIPTFAFVYTDRIHGIEIKKRFCHDTLSTIIIHFPRYVEDGHESYVDLSLHYLFEFVTLPSLRSLKVICPRNTGDVERPARAWEANAYEEMVARSQCRVERLELVNIYVGSSDIQRTLLASPHLTHYTLFDVQDEKHSGTESTESLLECLRA